MYAQLAIGMAILAAERLAVLAGYEPLRLLGSKLFWLVFGRPKRPELVRNVEQLSDGHFGRILGYFFPQPFWLSFCEPKQLLVFTVSIFDPYAACCSPACPRDMIPYVHSL